MHLKPSEANIQLHIVISTGGTLHTQHRKYRRLLCRIHQWIPRCCERVPTFKKAPNIHCLLNLSYRILNELPLVLWAGIGHLRINIQKNRKHKILTVVILPLFLHMICIPTVSRRANTCFHHCQAYYCLHRIFATNKIWECSHWTSKLDYYATVQQQTTATGWRVADASQQYMIANHKHWHS